MKELELYEDDLIDLGQASVETKGDAIYKATSVSDSSSS
jgi:hypothetical protein